MITQKYQQGPHEIKIESAESLDDARKNNFQEGIYSRYYINNKPILDYNAIIQFIIEETKKNKNQIIYDKDELIKTREKVLKDHNDKIKSEMLKIKAIYVENNASSSVLQSFDEMIQKIDITGVRIEK